MYEVKIASSFSSAHSLRDYKGKCEALHGHNWKVEVMVTSSSLDSLGMVIDFSELKKIVNDILGQLDHKHLNDLEYFRSENPSSERIAQYIFGMLKERLPRKECELSRVQVWETPNSCASYHE